MSQRYLGLDLGHRYLKLCVAEENNFGVLTPLSLVDRKIYSFKNGEIIDTELFQEEVVNFLLEISKQIGQKISNIALSFSAPYFTSYQAHGRAIVQGKSVHQDDLERAIRLAKMSMFAPQNYTLWEEPLYYLLDSATNKIRDPLGMEARTIEVHLLIIQAMQSTIYKIEQIFKKNKINLSQIVPNPIPASFAVLDKKDKENGVVLIDFGSSLISVTAFKDGSLIEFKTFPFGYQDLVQELAIMNEADLEETEKALESLLNESEEMVPKFKLKVGKKTITYQNLIKIFEKNLVQWSKNNGLIDWFRRLKENHKLPGGAFIFGSAAHLPEVQKIFKNIINMPIKFAKSKSDVLGERGHYFLNAWGLNLLQHKESSPGEISFWQKLKTLYQNLLFGR